MNSPFSRKLYLVSLFPDRMEDLEWPKKLCLQLLILFNLNVFAIQPNIITGGIASRLDAFIVGPFLKFLGMVEVLSTNNHQFS